MAISATQNRETFYEGLFQQISSRRAGRGSGRSKFALLPVGYVLRVHTSPVLMAKIDGGI